MKRLPILCLSMLAALSISLTGCQFASARAISEVVAGHEKVKPSKKITTVTYKTSDIHSVEVGTGLRVEYIAMAGSPRVEVTAPENLHQYIKIGFKRGNAEIGIEAGNHTLILNDVNVKVYSPRLKEVEVMSGASFTTKKLDTTGDFDLDISSGGSADVSNISCGKFELNVSSGASAKVSALKARKAEFETSSGSSATVDGLTAIEAEFEASSGSSITSRGINVDHLDASASSGAGIVLEGRARNRNTSASIGGHIDTHKLKTS